MKEFTSKKNLPNSELLKNTAIFFLDQPYVSVTLDQSEDESLVINLREFDCVTFVESCLSLVLTLKSENPSFEEFCRKLQSIRYRDGIIQSYSSRLHYTSDWIYENEMNGLVEDLSAKFGGRKLIKSISFMTDNFHLYKHLKNNRNNVEKMKSVELSITNRNNYIIISSPQISDIENNIKDGDIIAFGTKTKGLDYFHLGIAYWVGGKLHFIHASSREKKTIIEEKPLSSYCKFSKMCSGISVLNLK